MVEKRKNMLNPVKTSKDAQNVGALIQRSIFPSLVEEDSHGAICRVQCAVVAPLSPPFLGAPTVVGYNKATAPQPMFGLGLTTPPFLGANLATWPSFFFSIQIRFLIFLIRFGFGFLASFVL